MCKHHEISLADKKAAGRAFDFIDRIRLIEDVDNLKASFIEEANAFGFEFFAFAHVNPSEQVAFFTKSLDTWPPEWRERYLSERYVVRDPVARVAVSNLLPFTWNDLVNGQAIPKTDQLIFDEARVWRMNYGLCIPVRNLDNLQAVVSLSGPNPDLSEGAKGALHLMAIYLYARVVQLSDIPLQQYISSRRLSPRERECTAWIAAGKSSWEIGEILGLSELTIAAYIKSAMHKLNVVTRAQLVAEAIRLKEILL